MEKASKPVRLTYQDLLRLPDDLLRHELIDGEHYMTPAPSRKHQRAAGNLYLILGMYLREHPLGRVYFAPLDVLFSDFDVVEPDLLYVSREREERQGTERYLAGAPDLVIEVLSPSTRRVDEGAKFRLYERYGVPEYWVIDPISETVRIYRLVNGTLQLHDETSRGKGISVPVFTTPLFPGLEITLEDIFT
jgi:Uma2 family endonuclease